MRWLGPYLKPFRKQLIFGPFFKLLEAILELLLPTVMALIIDHGVAAGDRSYVLRMGGLMVWMALAGFGFSCLCQYSAALASQGFGTRLRDALFEHIAGLSWRELEGQAPSTLTNRLTVDINQLQLGVAMLIRLAVRAPFICIGAIVMAMILDMKLSLILLGAAPLLILTLYAVIRATSPLYRMHQQKLDALAALLRENLSGVRVIRAFAQRRREAARLDAANDALNHTANRVGRIAALLSPATSLIMNLTILLILWSGGMRIQGGSFTQGQLIAYINYITQVLLTLVVLSNLIIIFTRAHASALRVGEVLALVPSIRPGEEERPLPQGPAVAFRGVSFAYGGAGDLALEDLEFAIQRGEKVGVIGATGSGKSTLVHLIARYYDATDGRVEVLGRDVRQYDTGALRRRVALVAQKSLLFSGTIASNLRLGAPEADEQALREAASAAQALDFIEATPQGFDAPVARGGQNLSGGQRQRLSIARALIMQPDILILDDSASALDFATEAALRRALSALPRQMTVVTVSQRVGSVMHCDRILVLEEGEMADFDTHGALLAHCPVYREIYRSQMSGEEAGA